MYTLCERDGKAQRVLLFWMLSSVITTKKLKVLPPLLHKARTIPHYTQNYSWGIQKQECCVFALAAPVFKRLEMSKFRQHVKLQLCPQCLQHLWVQHLIPQYTPVHLNPQHAETLTTAQGPRNNLGAMSILGDSPAPAERLAPARIFICSQFLTWISCSGFIFPWGLLYRPNGQISTGTNKRSTTHAKVMCSTEVYILVPVYKNTKAHQKKITQGFL